MIRALLPIAIFLLFVPSLVLGASRTDVISRCSEAAAGKRNNTICIGYDNDDECSGDVSKCEFAFAAVSSTKSGRYRVRLVGKGGGWVSLAFSDDEEKVMVADNLGVICINTIEPAIQILQIANIPPKPEVKKGFALDNTYLSQDVKEGKLEIQDGWMVCEFTLGRTIRHKDKTFDLRKAPLKLGLAVNPEETIHGPDDMYANVPFYHKQTRGASEKFVNVFQKL